MNYTYIHALSMLLFRTCGKKKKLAFEESSYPATLEKTGIKSSWTVRRNEDI